jgi:hypothetical protein
VKNADGSLCLIGCAAARAVLQMPAFGELKEHAPNSVRGGELKGCCLSVVLCSCKACAVWCLSSRGSECCD